MDSETPLDVNDRIQAKTVELGRRLTAQELIAIINSEPDEVEELVYESDEDS